MTFLNNHIDTANEYINNFKVSLSMFQSTVLFSNKYAIFKAFF